MQKANWMPHFGMNFNLYVDGLGLLFSLLITGIGSLIILYSISYLSRQEQLGNFYCYLLLFMGAMLGVVLSDNLIILYLFWELTSFSSFLLISFWRDKQASIYGAQIHARYGIRRVIAFRRYYITFNCRWDNKYSELIQNVSEIQTSPFLFFQ